MLVVDDDPQQLELLEADLPLAGFEVHTNPSTGVPREERRAPHFA